ncbi:MULTISPECIES: phenylalanine--tRNA ligase beta subunit-related protein [Streptomyces]|uniref:Phenylalanine--tRNA ligase beta subunit-related protein n=1 Tax=Streptomyces luteosporeus TaxID=173856 RepID=A0ABP6GGX5_9ACTN
MYFTHADAVWEAHPGLRAAVIAVDGVLGITATRAYQDKLLPRVEERLAAGGESAMPEISAWREAFSAMGLKPTQYRCASEALLRRYRKERSLPAFHPLVDYLNTVSMAFAVPVAVFDCDRVAGGITVRPAEGTEEYTTFQGDSEHPAPGEVVFTDAAGYAHSRRWTFRQSARSVVGPHTERALIVAEALHPSAEADLTALQQEITTVLGECRVRVGAAKLVRPTERRLEFFSAFPGEESTSEERP